MNKCDRYDLCKYHERCHICQTTSSAYDPYPYYISKTDTNDSTTTKENIDIHRIIDEAMEKKDRMVTIFISESGTTISVTPIDKKPRWIAYERDDNGFRDIYKCSECGQHSSYPHVYCPDCGEKLNGVEVIEKEIDND